VHSVLQHQFLSPSEHQKGEYRRYGAEDEHRLEQICTYRKAGVPLKDIGKILDSSDSDVGGILEQRFVDLNNEIEALREQQRLIAGLLQNSDKLSSLPVMTKKLWVSLLVESGFTEEDMRRWHAQFERTAPGKHECFLRLLQIPQKEIDEIRRYARMTDTA
jgi:DNA-binding transcriptional MerR regulator